MFQWLKRTFFPNTYMEWKLIEILERDTSLGYGQRIQEILDLDISLLAKFLFIYESFDWATQTISRLSKKQKLCLLEEVKKINISDSPWRLWMYNHIEQLCNHI